MEFVFLDSKTTSLKKSENLTEKPNTFQILNLMTEWERCADNAFAQRDVEVSQFVSDFLAVATAQMNTNTHFVGDYGNNERNRLSKLSPRIVPSKTKTVVHFLNLFLPTFFAFFAMIR